MNLIKRLLLNFKKEVIHSVPACLMVGDCVMINSKYGAIYYVEVETVLMYENGWVYESTDMIGRTFNIAHFPFNVPKNPITITHSKDDEVYTINNVFDLRD